MIEPTLFSLKARIIHSNLKNDITKTVEFDSRRLVENGFYSLDKPAYTLIAADISQVGIIGEAVLTTQAELIAAITERLRDGIWAFTSKYAPVMGTTEGAHAHLLVLMRPSMKNSSIPVFDLLAVGEEPYTHARSYQVSVTRNDYTQPIMVTDNLSNAARFYTKSLLSYGQNATVSLERLVPNTYASSNPVMEHLLVPISSFSL